MKAVCVKPIFLLAGLAGVLFVATGALADKPWVCGGKTNFVGECGRCVSQEQCKGGLNCCPRMKVCVGRTGCPPPNGNCDPLVNAFTAEQMTEEAWNQSNCSGSVPVSLRDWVNCSAAVPAAALSLWNAATIAAAFTAIARWLA